MSRTFDFSSSTSILVESKKLDISKVHTNFLAWQVAFAQAVATRSLSTAYNVCKRGYLPKEFREHWFLFDSSTVWVQTANNSSEQFGKSYKTPITAAMLKAEEQRVAAEQQILETETEAISNSGKRLPLHRTFSDDDDNSPARSKPRMASEWTLPEASPRAALTSKAREKLMVQDEFHRATEYIKNAQILLEMMKANMTTASLASISAIPEFAKAADQADLLQCWHYIKREAILMLSTSEDFVNSLKDEMKSDHNLEPGGDFSLHASKWLSLLELIKFVDKGDAVATETTVTKHFVSSLPSEKRFQTTTDEMRDYLRNKDDDVIQCRKSLSMTINRYNMTITMTVVTSPTKAGGGADADGEDQKKQHVLITGIEDHICRNFRDKATCRFGDACRYKHGATDIRFNGTQLKPEYAEKVKEATEEYKKQRYKNKNDANKNKNDANKKVYVLNDKQLGQLSSQIANAMK